MKQEAVIFSVFPVSLHSIFIMAPEQCYPTSFRLCLTLCNRDWELLQLWVAEDDGSFKKRWRKLIAVEKAVAAPYVLEPKPVCLSNGDDGVVVLSAKVRGGEDDVTGEVPKAKNRKYKHFTYNPRQNCSFHEIDFEWENSDHYFPYTENLYMPFFKYELVVNLIWIYGLLQALLI